MASADSEIPSGRKVMPMNDPTRAIIEYRVHRAGLRHTYVTTFPVSVPGVLTEIDVARFFENREALLSAQATIDPECRATLDSESDWTGNEWHYFTVRPSTRYVVTKRG